MKKQLLKNIAQKTIIIITIFVLTLSFIFPTKSRAEDLGGVLAKPLTFFALFLLDTVEGALQYYFIGGPFRTITVSFNEDDYLIIEDQLKLSENKSDKKVEDDVRDYQFILTSYISDSLGWNYIVTKFSPAEIFMNKIPLFSINFIDPPDTGNNQESIASALQATISSWYKALRMLAFVGMLSILVYVGIRMILSSTAGDKSKYKSMLMDWVVALCLLFFLHYIMEFTLIVTDSITAMVSSVGGSDFEVVLKQNGSTIDNLGGTPYVTNLMGLARFRAQNENLAPRLMYIIIYAMLLTYTVIFAFAYLKRVLMMAFLTIISPIIVLTYPIDKISDGSAQGFNMWLKEYIFNALLQPVHCILYAVLVGSALELATDNPFYAIAAMAFILPAEQLMRKFFNFSKASAGTVGGVEGFASGLLANKFLGDFSSRMKSGNSGGNSGGDNGGSNGSSSNNRIRTQNGPDIGSLFGGSDGSHGSPSTPPIVGGRTGALPSGNPTSSPGGGQGAGRTQTPRMSGGQGAGRTQTPRMSGRQGAGRTQTPRMSGGQGELTPEQIETYQKGRDYMQAMLDDPDLSPKEREEYQRNLDNYNNKLSGIEGGNESEQLTPEQIDNYRMQRDNMQMLLDDPDLSPKERALYQENLDSYNDKLSGIEGGNESEQLTPEQIDDYRMQRDNMQMLLDDPDLSPEERASYQENLDFYNDKLSGIEGGGDDQEQLMPESEQTVGTPGLINSQQAQQNIEEGSTSTESTNMPLSYAVPEPVTTTPVSSGKKPSANGKGKKVIRGIKNVATSPEVAEGIKAGARAAVKYTVAGGLGVIAFAATMAGTADMSKSFVAATSAAAVGSGMTDKAINTGKKIVKKASSAKDTIQNRYIEGAEGEQEAQRQAREREMATEKKEFMKNTANINKAKEMAYNLKQDDYKKVLEDTYKLRKRGIEEKNIEKTLEVAYGQPGGEAGVGIDKAGAVAKETQKYGTDVLLDKKKSRILRKKFQKEIMEKGSGNISEDQAKERAKEVMRLYEKFI